MTFASVRIFMIGNLTWSIPIKHKKININTLQYKILEMVLTDTITCFTPVTCKYGRFFKKYFRLSEMKKNIRVSKFVILRFPQT